MIELTDITLRETQGNFSATARLMEDDVPGQDWMLRSNAYISNQLAAATYTLHFWKNGRVVISGTDRPMTLESSDEDLRELSEWCRKTGWKELSVDDMLLADRQRYEFWRRAFIAGMIASDVLQKHEDEEIERLSQAQLKESEEENAPQTDVRI